MFREGDVHDKKYQARLFDTFLVAVYLYDDDMKIVFSFSGDKNTIRIPLNQSIDNIENCAESSYKLCLGPPKSHTNLDILSETLRVPGGCGLFLFPFFDRFPMDIFESFQKLIGVEPIVMGF